VLFRRKLPRVSFVLLCLSFLCALGSAVAMRAYARRIDERRPDGGPPRPVVVAGRDLPRGATLTTDALDVLTMPSRFAPPGALRDEDAALGRVLVADLAAGEVVTRLRLAGAGAGPTAALVPPGMRAVPLPIAATTGVHRGDVIDVLATFGGGGAHTEVSAEALEVVSVRRGGGALGPTTSPSAAGLIVVASPDDAERLAFAAAFATLSIAIRGPGDETPMTFSGLPTDPG
jgi:Flp pilus assembly protein CpaB